MKHLILFCLSLLIFSSCQQDEVVNQVANRESRAVYYGIDAQWPRLSYDIGGELIDIRYVNAESGGMDAGYCMHTRGTMVAEIVLHNSNHYSVQCKATDFYFTSNYGTYPPYRKVASLHLDNSYSSAVSSVTLDAKETKTVYIYTLELFREGFDKYDYNTTPPFTIDLWYKDSYLLCDDIDVEYDENRSYWEKYR